MSDYSSDFGNSGNDYIPRTQDNPYERPPYLILYIGLLAAPIFCSLLAFTPPTGSNTIGIGIILWILSLASYFVPFALFTVSDLAKQTSQNYVANEKKSHRLRILLLAEGSFCLIFPTFYLASSMASWVAVISG